MSMQNYYNTWGWGVGHQSYLCNNNQYHSHNSRKRYYHQVGGEEQVLRLAGGNDTDDEKKKSSHVVSERLQLKKLKNDTTTTTTGGTLKTEQVLYDKGDKVYAAWWSQDTDRSEANPTSWYPGTIKTYKMLRQQQVQYSVVFDDGDKLDNLDEHHIMTKSDYLKKMKKELKPLFDKGDEVYAAFWPDDKRSASTPSWYTGKVKNYRVVKGSENGVYGSTRFYDIEFDDGDKIDNLEDAYIFNKEDYLLTIRLDNNEGPTKKKWLGVKNVVDEKSSDLWANLVGWYTADINGEEHIFSLLSDALRAYDAHVMESSQHTAKKSQLNLPEEWSDVSAAGRDGERSPRKPKSKPAVKEERRVSSRVNATIMKKIRVGSRILVKWPKDGNLYKATVKKLSLDKELQQVTVHFDGRKKQSLDDIHPSLIQDIEEEVFEEALKHKKTPDPGVRMEDRNVKIKRVHEAAVQKLQSRIDDLENSMKSLTAQKDTAIMNETKANSDNSKFRLKIEELTLKLKTVEEDAKSESKDSAAEPNLTTMTKELETTKTRLLEAQEQVSVYHNIAQSSEQEVDKHKSKVRELLLKLGTAQRDVSQSIGIEKSLQDKVAVLKNELKSIRDERNKTMNELTAQIDSLTSELFKSKNMSTKLTYESNVAKKRKSGKERADIQVKVKVSNCQIGGELTAAVPRPIELNQDRTTTKKMPAQTEKPLHLNNFESSHTLAANLPFEPPALPPLPGMANHEPTTATNTREGQPLQVQFANTEDLAVAAAEQYVDSIVADETPTAGRSDAMSMSHPQTGRVETTAASQISELTVLLRAMPPNVRKAAKNNPDLVAQLMAENEKKQGSQLNQPFGLNTLAEASNLHSNYYDDPGQQHQYMNTQHQWPANNLQGYEPYYATAQFQQIQQPYYPLGQPTSSYGMTIINQFESTYHMNANNLRQIQEAHVPTDVAREANSNLAFSQAEEYSFEQGVIALGWGKWEVIAAMYVTTRDVGEIQRYATSYQDRARLEEAHYQFVHDQPQHKKLSPLATTVNENAEHDDPKLLSGKSKPDDMVYNILKSMPPHVRKAAENNPDVVIKLHRQHLKKKQQEETSKDTETTNTNQQDNQQLPSGGLWPEGTEEVLKGMMQQNDSLQANEVHADESWPQPPLHQNVTAEEGGVNESSSVDATDDTPPAQIDIMNEDTTTQKKLTIMMRMSPSRPRRFLNAKEGTGSQLTSQGVSHAASGQEPPNTQQELEKARREKRKLIIAAKQKRRSLKKKPVEVDPRG